MGSVLIRQLIAHIDSLVKEQLIVILEDKNFKDLLSNWSCLKYLVDIGAHSSIKIKLFDLRWHEIHSLVNADNSLDSIIAQKILGELDLPGSDPLSLIVGSYTLDVADKNTIDTLTHITKICAYSFVPFITSISSQIFDIDDFSQIARLNIDEIYKNKKFQHLIKLASDIDSSFVGLSLPKLSFPSLFTSTNKLNYCPVLGTSIKQYKTITGISAYAFAAVIINSFIRTGWFLDIVGMPTDDLAEEESFGVVPKLKSESFFEQLYLETNQIFFNPLTEIVISEHKEKELADLGFIPLCHIRDRDFAVFYSTNSVRSLNTKGGQNKNFEIGSALQYMLCVCRFAHYIRIISRQKLGLYSNISEFLQYLNNWLLNYISSNVETPLQLKHRYPLLDAKIELFEDNFLKNSFTCMIHLKPHLMSMQVSADIVLKTKITLPAKDSV